MEKWLRKKKHKHNDILVLTFIRNWKKFKLALSFVECWLSLGL